MGNTGTVRRNDELCELMEAMAQRDGSALFTFIDRFGPELTSTVRSILGSVGRSDVGWRSADVEFLVMSAALVVYDRAHRWDCEGAVPWLWAIRAVRGEIVRWLGHPRVEFIPEFHGSPVEESAGSRGDVTYRDLAAGNEEIAAWIGAVHRVTGRRNADVHIEYQTQKSLGDPSPAHTIGHQFGLQPANVRQIDRRVRQQLAKLGEASINPVLVLLTQ